jgi:hypothetical protein
MLDTWIPLLDLVSDSVEQTEMKRTLSDIMSFLTGRGCSTLS